MSPTIYNTSPTIYNTSPTACHPQYMDPNHPLLSESITVLHTWIHEGTAEEHQRKLGLFKDLGGEFDDDVAQEMAYRIVETLLTVSKGRPPNDHNRRGFYPYGRLAGNAHTHQPLSLFRTHTHTHTRIHT